MCGITNYLILKISFQKKNVSKDSSFSFQKKNISKDSSFLFKKRMFQKILHFLSKPITKVFVNYFFAFLNIK
jgi:hypothetical protein